MSAIHPTPARPAGPCLSAFERRCLIKRMAAQRLIARAVSLAVRLSDADLLMAGEGTTGPVKKKTP